MSNNLKLKEGGVKVVANVRMIKSSPRKLCLVAKAIRGMTVSSAVGFLRFSRKAVSYDVAKALNSAVANAENNLFLDSESLKVVEAVVGKAAILKRFSARAKGRGVRIRKRFSRLKIVLGETE